MKKLFLIQLILSFTLIIQAQMPNINNLHQKQFLERKLDINENTVQKVIQNSTIVSKSVNISAGGLSKALTKTEKTTVTNLTITGSIDARDFVIIRDSMSVLAVLDISAVSIAAYSGSDGTDTIGINKSYPVNAIPQFAFSDPFSSISGKKTLTTINLPATIISIFNNSFANCTNLSTVNFPNALKTIGKYAFSNCNLYSVTIPSSVSTIDDYVFDRNTYLYEFIVLSGNINFSSANGVLFNKYKTTIVKYPNSKSGVSYSIPNTVTFIGNGAFNQCWNLDNITIPNSVKTIGEHAFEDSWQLKNFIIPNSVTTIGNYAFNNSGLTNLILPNTITTIGNYAFDSCNSLTDLIIPNSVTSIGVQAFPDAHFSLDNGNINYSITDSILYNKDQTTLILCPHWKINANNIPNSVTALNSYSFRLCSKLTSVIIPNSVVEFGQDCFSGCIKLTNIVIPNSVKTIENGCFNECESLITIELPNSVTTIGLGAFAYCSKLTSVKIGNSIKKIDYLTFYSCPKLTDFVFGNSIDTIGNYAFLFSGLKNVILPNSVKYIGDFSFYGCSNLQNLFIGNSVSYIGTGAFEDCKGLKNIYVYPVSPVNLNSSKGVFSNINKTTCNLFVPIGTKSAYQSANQWLDFVNIKEIQDLEVSSNTAILESNSGSMTTVDITSSYTWSATSDQTWLTVNPVSGTYNATITLTASENTSTSNRTATVTITETGGAFKIITITQTKQSIPVTISKKWNDVLICNNTEKVLSSYQWFKNNTVITGETKQYYQELGGLNGNYYLKVIANDGRTGVSNTITVNKAAAIKVYPNPIPTGTEFNVKVQSSDADFKGSQLSILNVTGELVLQKTEVQENITLKGLQKGYYIVQLKLVNGDMISEKLIVK